LQSVPAEIDTIADLTRLAPLLLGKGYSGEDVTNILGNNWLKILHQRLPETE
jgi:microsomal dipeptidase-like Zn-dependent dipeptidase